jgi:hypothetical protein
VSEEIVMGMPFVDKGRSFRASALKDTDRVMLINADRVLYCGLLGQRSVMTLAHSLYLYRWAARS